MLLGSPTLVFVTKNKNYFVIQCFMHNLIISNVLDEESGAKKYAGSKEKLAFAEFRVLYFRPVKHRTGRRKNMKTSFTPFAATYYGTFSHCSSPVNFSMWKWPGYKTFLVFTFGGVSWVYFAIKMTGSFLWKVL